MRIKKAFTLAEILIVLTVIGVIATMTVPSLSEGATAAQYKSGLKKAYSVVQNVAAAENAKGNLPSEVSTAGMVDFFAALNNSLAVKEYATIDFGSRDILSAGSTTVGIIWNSKHYGDTSNGGTSAGNAAIGTFSPWQITEDNMAYAVTAPRNGACSRKSAITSASSQANALSSSCIIVAIDVNGLNKGPNLLEPQITDDSLSATTKLGKLKGDRYYIYVGNDGASTGPKETSVSGRIINDLR